MNLIGKRRVARCKAGQCGKIGNGKFQIGRIHAGGRIKRNRIGQRRAPATVAQLRARSPTIVVSTKGRNVVTVFDAHDYFERAVIVGVKNQTKRFTAAPVSDIRAAQAAFRCRFPQYGSGRVGIAIVVGVTTDYDTVDAHIHGVCGRVIFKIDGAHVPAGHRAGGEIWGGYAHIVGQIFNGNDVWPGEIGGGVSGKGGLGKTILAKKA